MSLRDDLLPVVNALRSLPNTFGLRRYTVAIRRRAWSGGKPGNGVATVTDLAINPPPKVRFVSTEEIASSGGTYREGDVMIDRITPRFVVPTTGGFSPVMLNIRPNSAAEDVAIVLNGDEGLLEAEVIKFNFTRAFNYWMVVRLVRAGVRG